MTKTQVHSPNKSKTTIITILISGLMLAFGLAGCGGGSNSPPVITVTFSDATVAEGDSGTTDLVFSATISPAPTSAVSIDYATADGTATAGSDFTSDSNTLQISAGSTSASITVALTADTDIEADETLTLNLSNVTGATLAVASVTGTISNDDHANPSGYYTGGATVKDPNNVTTDLVFNDLHVMVSANRMMMMSVSSVLIYDAQITNISGNDFTGTVTIYTGTDQDPTPDPILARLSGTITEGTRVEGTIIGSGAATGTFTADFNSMSSTASDSASIAKTWSGEINGRVDMVMKFTVDSAGIVTSQFIDNPLGGIFAFCRLNGSITPIGSESLYGIDLDMSNCGTNSSDGNYTGFAIPTSIINDALVFAFSKDNVAGISVLSVVP